MTISGEETRKGQSDLPASALFSNSFNLKQPYVRKPYFRATLSLILAIALQCPAYRSLSSPPPATRPTFSSKTWPFVPTEVDSSLLQDTVPVYISFRPSRLLKCVPAPGISNIHFFEAPESPKTCMDIYSASKAKT